MISKWWSERLQKEGFMMQFGFLCQQLHAGTVKYHINQQRRCLGWDMNLAPHEHESEAPPHVPTYLVFQKERAELKTRIFSFICWLKRGCLFAGKNTYANEELREILWSEKNEVSSLEQYMTDLIVLIGKGKAVPLQAWSGPESSRKLRFPDFMTTAQDGGKVVSLTHRPPLPPGNTPGTHFC